MAKDIEEVAGTGATIRFEAGKCIHSRGCVLGRPDVFVPNVQGAWIHPDAATVEQIAELAHGCPSGAITYLRLDGGAQEPAPVVNWCASARTARSRFTHSSSSREPATEDSQPLAQRNGAVSVTPAENGPLLVAGSLEIVSGTGRTIHRCVKAAFCRCGGSSNTPFCDGTHKTNGFRASGPK